MKKLLKWFSIFAVIGTAIGLAVAYFCKSSSGNPDEDEKDYAEDEDFDLDADLKPAEREYVSLKKDSDKEDALSREDAEEESAESEKAE